MLLALGSPMLSDLTSAASDHPVGALATALAIITVLLFVVFGGGKSMTGAASHALSSAFALLLLSVGLGAVFWITFPGLFGQYADSDTLQHYWAPAVAAVAWVLMVARLRASRRVHKWRTPPLAEQVKAERRASRLRR